MAHAHAGIDSILDIHTYICIRSGYAGFGAALLRGAAKTAFPASLVDSAR